MAFEPEDLSIDLLHRATGVGAAGGISPVAQPGAAHNTGSLLKGGLQGFSSVANFLSNASPYLKAGLLALQFGGRLHDYLTESPREALEKEILQARRERLGDLRRQAKGDFMPGERQNILRANEPVMNRIASNIAQRGLEASGAALETLAAAEQAPFLHAQQLAQMQLDSYDLQTFALTQKMGQEDAGFMQNLSDLTGLWQTDPEPDADLEGFNQSLTELSKAISDFKQFAEELEN